MIRWRRPLPLRPGQRVMNRMCATSTTTMEVRAEIRRLTVGILRAAGRPVVRRKARRSGGQPTNISHLEPDLQKAIGLFDGGSKAGLALRDRVTISLLARACCVPHSPWEVHELPRVLLLFDSMQRPFIHLHSSTNSHTSGLDQRWSCEVGTCGRIARFGDAAEGLLRRCTIHRTEVSSHLYELLQTIARFAMPYAWMSQMIARHFHVTAYHGTMCLTSSPL